MSCIQTREQRKDGEERNTIFMHNWLFQTRNLDSHRDYTKSSQVYDDYRYAASSDVMAAMMQFQCKRSLQDLYVLDAGCGTGNYSKHFLEFGVGHITLLDASSEMLQKAEEKLKDYLANGRIKNIVKATMPQLPFPDDTFDVVVLSGVLHHLESAIGEREFTNTTEALKESKRVLKRNGLIIVATLLPSSTRHSTWFSQIHSAVTERHAKLFPTVSEYNNIFESIGLKCFHKMNVLGSDILKDYNNFEGPLDEHWRLSNCYWELATEQEMKEIKSFITDLKEKGELETWARQHDHVNTVGFVTMLLLRIDNN